MRSGSSRLHNLLCLSLSLSPHSFPSNVPFAHSSRFLCPLSSFLVRHSFPSFFPLFFAPSPPLSSARHCFRVRNSDTNSLFPTTVCVVWERRARLPMDFVRDTILFASVFSICSSLLLLLPRTINAPLKSCLSRSFFLRDIYKVSRGIFSPFSPRYRVAGSIGVYCMNYSSNICITGEGRVYCIRGLLESRIEKKREKKKKAIGRDDLSVNGEWKSECPIRERRDPGSYSVGIIASASIRQFVSSFELIYPFLFIHLSIVRMQFVCVSGMERTPRGFRKLLKIG